MQHDWIFDVLADLKSYALVHGFLGLADKADEAIVAAEREVRAADQAVSGPQGQLH